MTTTPPPKSSPPGPSGWRLAAALPVALLVVGLLRWSPLGPQNAPEGVESDARGGLVTLEKRLPDAPAQSAQVAWSAGTTVLEATRLAGEGDPAWASDWRGEGAMALLVTLGGEANQGADGLNWQFEVNGVYADRGAGAFELEPGDRVLWKLAPYE